MKWLMLLALLVETGLFGSGLAYADGKKMAVPANPQWKEECGSCHIAYPPGYLTAADWQQLMGSLNRHFGDNAAIDPEVNRQILEFLKRHAGSGATHSASSLRISDTPWFSREHREVPARAWTDPAVKGRANCTACHINAEGGDWSEHGVRMPAGLGEEEDEGGDDDDED
jgi:nitrate/TMAO reductase-like tetraheme cytochrome c subunit